MRKNLLLVLSATVCLIIAALLFSNWPTTPEPLTTGQSDTKYPQAMTGLDPAPPPKADWRDFEGNDFDPVSLKGKYVLINFWATWCPPCVTEYPGLVSFTAEHHNDFAVILVSNDREAEKAKAFFAKQTEDIQKHMRLPEVIQIHDPKGAITRDVFQTYRLPESYLLNPDGQMVAKITGTVSPDHFNYIEALLP